MKKLRKNVMAGMTAVAAGMVLTGCSGMPSMSGAEFRRRLMAEIRRQNEARNAAQAQTPAPAPDMSRITEKIEDVLMEQGEGIAIRDFVSGLDEETIGSIIGYDGSIDRISLLYGPPDVIDQLTPVPGQEETPNQSGDVRPFVPEGGEAGQGDSGQEAGEAQPGSVPEPAPEAAPPAETPAQEGGQTQEPSAPVENPPEENPEEEIMVAQEEEKPAEPVTEQGEEPPAQ